MSFVFRALAPPGERVQQIAIGGRPIDLERTYTIAGCERDGEPLEVICRMRGARDVVVLPQTIHHALREYLRKHPVIAPRRDGRARASDLPATVFSQDAVLSQQAGARAR